ncbi:MAG TPA: ZIP family metal transporter [Blastocatellia bacterium]|nr:ZIP family metal transporter [Blastocatellia bacterium]
MNPLIQLIGFGLLAAMGNIIGGYLITGSRAISQRLLRYLIAFGAGFMLAAVFLEVIPVVALEWNGRLITAMGLALAGYLLIQFVEHTIAPHFHFGKETHSEEMMRRGAAGSAIIGLSVHTFFDGVAIASGLLTSFRLGLLLFIAILLHKIPEGFTVASIALASGRDNRLAMRATSLIAVATFAGIILTFALEPAVKYTLPFSAGVTLYVAASDLIPEVNRRDDHDEVDLRTSLLVFAGAALFYLAHLMLHDALD